VWEVAWWVNYKDAVNVSAFVSAHFFRLLVTIIIL
jgi:hypothetical protein